MRVVAFIQARAGGSRFPGKVFAPSPGSRTQSLLDRAISDAGYAVRDGVYLLVPQGQAVQFAGYGVPYPFHRRHFGGVPIIEGPEDEVHRRFVEAAAAIGLADDDIIVRWTPDDPMKQVGLIHAAIWQAKQTGYGDTNHAFGLEGWGAQAFTVRYMLEHPDPEHVVVGRAVDCPATVDTPADLARLEAMCAGW